MHSSTGTLYAVPLVISHEPPAVLCTSHGVHSTQKRKVLDHRSCTSRAEESVTSHMYHVPHNRYRLGVEGVSESTLVRSSEV